MLDSNTLRRVRSPWREFEFWLMNLQHAIVPRLSLAKTLVRWPLIREKLAEPPRRRALQMDYMDALF